MGLAKPLHLRLFLEGVEVPVVSAQVSINMWSPASAAIQVVPLPQILDLKARTMVHLFFLEEPLVRDASQANITLAQLRSESGADTGLSDEAYKLLFCGELVGFSFVKTPMSRAVILQCLDHSAYWDALQATMLDYGPKGNAFISKASLYASNEALFSNVPTRSQGEQLKAWILSKPKTPGLENVAGLAGGILSVMEIMGGLRNYRLGTNDFFTIAELRCHLLSQVTAEDGDSTAQNVLSTNVFWDWLYNNLQGQSGQISLRDMFKLLCQYIYYSIVPNPVAKYDANITQKPVKIPPQKVKAIQSAEYGSVVGACQRIVQGYSQRPPENYQECGNWRLQVRDELVKPLEKIKGVDAEAIRLAKYVDTVLLQAWKKGTALSSPMLISFRDVAGRALDKLDAMLKQGLDKTVDVPGHTTFVNAASRLRTQIFRPDCYMAPPPACNVIFPEQYSQISYDRNFLGEVTRVELSTYSKIVGPDALTATHLVQPSIYNSTDKVVKQINNKWRVLMDHELHTGIIAREEWLPDSFSSSVAKRDPATAKMLNNMTLSWQQRVGLHHFFKYRVGPRTLNGAGRFMPYLVCGFPGLVIQQPFYVPDDKRSKDITTDEDMISRIMKSKNPAVELDAPPQFLGLIEGISHSIGQDGGHTSFSMSHCRNHLGIDDEFVGSVLAKSKSQGGGSHLVRYVVRFQDAKDQKTLNFLRDCTPQAPPDKDSGYVKDRYLADAEVAYTVKSFNETTGVQTLQKKVQVKKPAEPAKTSTDSKATAESQSPNGHDIKIPSAPGKRTLGSEGLHGGKIRIIQVLDESLEEFGGQKHFRSIMVYEDIFVSDGNESQDVPFEYVVQPSWLSSSYDNSNVGQKVYQQFFGCDSIVDQLDIKGIGLTPRDPDGILVKAGEETNALKARIQKIEAQKGLISIEKAVNVIAYLYGKVRAGKLDVDEFVESFTRRPVATKRDMLGSYDLELKVAGSSVTATKGTVGFHTYSVHPSCVDAKNLCGLMDNPAMKLSNVAKNSGQLEAVKASYDIRWQKLNKVRAYKEALEKGARGFVG